MKWELKIKSEGDVTPSCLVVSANDMTEPNLTPQLAILDPGWSYWDEKEETFELIVKPKEQVKEKTYLINDRSSILTIEIKKEWLIDSETLLSKPSPAILNEIISNPIVEPDLPDLNSLIDTTASPLEQYQALCAKYHSKRGNKYPKFTQSGYIASPHVY